MQDTGSEGDYPWRLMLVERDLPPAGAIPVRLWIAENGVSMYRIEVTGETTTLEEIKAVFARHEFTAEEVSDE